MRESIESYRKVYQMLEDQESKDTYLGRMAYLISDDHKYIENILTSYLPGMPLLSRRVRNLLDMLPQDREIILYGAGRKGTEAFRYLVDDKRFIGFCSNNVLKQNSGYLGYPVMSPESLLDRKDILVLVCAPIAREEIMRLLREGGYPQEYIFDFNAISAVADPRQYFDLDFIPYENEEVFIDAGCYDLCDTPRIQKYCRHLKRAYAFEPDPKNYKKCLERKQKNDLSEVEIFPFGT